MNKIINQPVNNKRLQLSLAFTISFFLHIILWIAIILPDLNGLLKLERLFEKATFRSRDIIVNINQDDKRQVTDKTLLSDKDSTAQGHITYEKGDQWLNNSLDFRVLSGSKPGTKTREKQKDSKDEKLLLHDESEIVIQLAQPSKPQAQAESDVNGMEGDYIKVLIPDKNDVTRKNAIYYSNKGLFSFNTAKFKNFQYFKDMKDKIASNWYPPIMANAIMGSSNPYSGRYAPGYTRIMAIPSQEVKLFFAMDREGTILDVQIIESYGNRSLDSSCVDAIRLSKSFGKVPEDIQGSVVVIPFIFGYYAY